MKLLTKIISFLRESKRVFQVTKKPTKNEYKTIVKVSALGIAIIGTIGFIINILAQVIPKLF